LDFSALLRNVSIYAIPLLFAIALHEVAHGWMARYLGDHTAELLGRLSLNPMRHIDPVGTVLVPGLLLAAGVLVPSILVTGIPVYGWARPMPVTVSGLRHPRRAAVCVALAGPAANLLMAAGWCAVLLAILRFHSVIVIDYWLGYMAQAGILINVVVALISLLPILPLDGGRILAAVLPERLGARFAKVEPLGLVIVLSLIAMGLIGWLFRPGLFLVGHIIDALFKTRA
jgi:Zn-dependent protease